MRKRQKDENPSNAPAAKVTNPHHLPPDPSYFVGAFIGASSQSWEALELPKNGQPMVYLGGSSNGTSYQKAILDPRVGAWGPREPPTKSTRKLWLPGWAIDLPTTSAAKALEPAPVERKGLLPFAAVLIGNFRAAVGGRAILAETTPAALPDFPRIWELAGYLLDHKSRRDVYDPSIEELKEDYYITRRKYRTRWARRWLRFSFAVRTIGLFFSCFRNMIGVVIRFLLLCWLSAPARAAVERILHLR